MRFFLLRVLAYCLAYEEGIAFSKAHSSTDEAPLSVRDPTGILLASIEIGISIRGEFHKASEGVASGRIFHAADVAQLRREAARSVRSTRSTRIDVWRSIRRSSMPLATKMSRTTKLDITRNDGPSTFSSPARVRDGPRAEPPLAQ